VNNPEENDWLAFDVALGSLSAPEPPTGLRERCLPSARRYTVLVVDDEPNIRRLVEHHLTGAGYRVRTATNGVEALERFAEETPDLVLLDVLMPRVDGLEVLRALKSEPESAGVPVLLLTARGTDDQIRRGWQEGTDLYLVKPFNPRELVTVVRRMLETAGTPDAPPPLRRWPK
jgi:DNA-binding response OmpR family regulator